MKKWLIGALGGLLLSHGAAATENYQWSTPVGVLFFGAGMLPPPSDTGTFGLRVLFGYNSALYDQSGHKLPNNFHQSVNVDTLTYIHMTNVEILGAHWGFLIGQPVKTLDGGFDISSPFGGLSLHDSSTGLADTVLEPFLLQWNFDHLFINSGVLIQPPTGQYAKTALFNAGNNYWTFGPHLAATYISPSGLELSSLVQVNFNTTNPATHYHTGSEFELEWAIGQHFGDFTIGPVGTIYQQLESDSSPTLTSTVQSRVFSAGLSVNFFHPGFPLTLQASVTKDFAAESHTQGISGALRAGLSF